MFRKQEIESCSSNDKEGYYQETAYPLGDGPTEKEGHEGNDYKESDCRRDSKC